MQKNGRPRLTTCLEDHRYAENGRCRACACERSARHRAKHREQVRAQDRARKAALDPERAQRAKARAVLGVALARTAAADAAGRVRAVAVRRATHCAECGKGEALAYQADPARPLMVRWLCAACRRYAKLLAQGLPATSVPEALEEDLGEAAAALQEAVGRRNDLRFQGEAWLAECAEAERGRIEAAVAAAGGLLPDGVVPAAVEPAVREFFARRQGLAATREALRRRFGLG